MSYNFDEIISRSGTNSVNLEAWKPYLLQMKADDRLPFPDEEMLRMWIADMEFDTPKVILDAIRARLDQRILGYTQVFDHSYYEVMDQWFRKRYQWSFNKEEVVFSPGVVQALSRLVELLTNAGEGILIHTPAYAPFQRAGDIHNRQVFHSALLLEGGKWKMDFDDIRRQLQDKSKNIKVLICCSPHNPTGRLWTEEELRELGEIARSNDCWIVSDEVHCDLLRVGKSHIPLAALFPDNDKIITCTAPSKTFNLAGNLLSHICIPNAEVRRRWLERYGDSLSPLSVEATKAAYQHGEEWLDALRQYLDGNFAYLKRELDLYFPKANFQIPDATYLAWIDLSAYVHHLDEGENWLQFFAKKLGILIEDESMFVANGKGHIRMNVASPRKYINLALERMKKGFFASV